MTSSESNFLRRIGYKRGFTLIELLATIAILTVLTALVFPTASNYIERAKEANLNREVELVNSIMGLKYSVMPLHPDLSYPETWSELHAWLTDSSDQTGIYLTFDDKSELSAAMQANNNTEVLIVGEGDNVYVW